jgi:AcrR family transcriptional regulator
MSEPQIRRRPGGRSARVRSAVLEATLDALSEHGADGLSVADVATRAGVHETSIYRRWGSRERLMIDALLSYSEHQLPIPDTGSLRQDLTVFATQLAAYLASPRGSTLLRALALATDDPSITEARDGFWQTRYELAKVMIERAVARDEIPDPADPRLALEILIAPLHFRTLLTSEPVDDTLLRRLVDLLIDGMTARHQPNRQHRNQRR